MQLQFEPVDAYENTDERIDDWSGNKESWSSGNKHESWSAEDWLEYDKDKTLSMTVFGCQETCDTTLIVGPGNLRLDVHKGVLTSFIPWFASAHKSGMVESRRDEYTFPDDAEDEWQAVLSRVYNPKTRFDAGCAAKCLRIAGKYDITWLEEEALEVLRYCRFAERTPELVDEVVHHGHSEIVEKWLDDRPYLRGLAEDPCSMINRLQSADALRLFCQRLMRECCPEQFINTHNRGHSRQDEGPPYWAI
eukprot:TRINITY_DN30652_c0_g1_i2.p1 TRINITY_DN30652_c0_g1~~TRINITY_DN30652_c0_g1_i2.p1  ORF type:complete len:256 (+),score=25.63 TRINITY_DN30652_c0_g1_i2:24-770(+)